MGQLEVTGAKGIRDGNRVVLAFAVCDWLDFRWQSSYKSCPREKEVPYVPFAHLGFRVSTCGDALDALCLGRGSRLLR